MQGGAQLTEGAGSEAEWVLGSGPACLRCTLPFYGKLGAMIVVEKS